MPNSRGKKIKNKEALFCSENFKVILDSNSGRPHLIMLSTKKKYHNIFDFEPPMLQLFLQYVNLVLHKLGPSIFSVHLGSYQSKTSPHFHAHFFINLQSYIKLGLEYGLKMKIDLNSWRKEVVKNGLKYKSHDLKGLEKLEKSKGFDLNKKAPFLPFGYKIRFHPNQPMLTIFKPDRKHEAIDEIILTLMYIAQYYGLEKGHGGKGPGAHLVIQHRGMSFDKHFKYYKGYLLIDIKSFYKINPKRKLWLQRFKREPYLIFT